VKPIKTTSKGERLVIDLIDLNKFIDKNESYRYVLNCIDAFSKYAWSFPIIHKSAEEVAASLKRLFTEQGSWKILQADNGTEFDNGMVEKICKILETYEIHGAPYHPQSQGVIERFNQTLKIQLYKWMNETNREDWMIYLPKAVEIYNRMVHDSTKMSPFEVWFGRPARVFVDLQETGKICWKKKLTVSINVRRRNGSLGYRATRERRKNTAESNEDCREDEKEKPSEPSKI
jgi:transposase InsO family protein